MTFEEILDQAIAMLQRHGRLTYRADWASAPSPPVALSPAPASQRAPLSYTPTYLTEKILALADELGMRPLVSHCHLIGGVPTAAGGRESTGEA